MPKVIASRCPQNHSCPMVRACPKGAIKQKGFSAPTIDNTLCIECGLCTRNCPYSCFEPTK